MAAAWPAQVLIPGTAFSDLGSVPEHLQDRPANAPFWPNLWLQMLGLLKCCLALPE